MEFVSDDGHMPILSDEELDFTSDFNIDMLDMVSEVITPPSDNNEAVLPPPVQDEDQATVVINIQNELDLLWNPLEISPAQPVVISPAHPVVGITNEQIEREKNNDASRAYRQR